LILSLFAVNILDIIIEKKEMNKKNLYIIVAIVIILSVVGIYYFNSTKDKNSQPGNNQEQQQNQENVTVLRDKILEMVGKANEGKTKEALEGYLALEKDNPTDLLLLNNIADLYSDMGNWAKSEEYYKKLLSAHPDFIQGYRMLAYLYQYRFNDDEAKIKALIDDGLSKNNNHPDLLNWIIYYYQEKGEGEKALPYSQILADKLNGK